MNTTQCNKYKKKNNTNQILLYQILNLFVDFMNTTKKKVLLQVIKAVQIYHFMKILNYVYYMLSISGLI